ncbi:MAG TPA: hypothetical protein PKJ21_02870, partial [Anaerolineae bacterium]|nr:hypothetical protein [Anaerolineae bacterium]
AFLGGRTTEDPTHLRLFSVAALRQLLAAFSSIQIVPVGGIGGGLLPVVPVQVSGALIRLWPQMLANDLLFCAVAPRGASRGSGE